MGSELQQVPGEARGRLFESLPDGKIKKHFSAEDSSMAK
jgi:hypothetical protein